MWFNVISLFFTVVVCSYLYPSVCDVTEILFDSSRQVVGSSIILRPNGAGDETGLLLKEPNVANYLNVDDVTPDGTTSYIAGGTLVAYHRDLYNIQDYAGDIPERNIAAVGIHIVVQGESGSVGYSKIVQKSLGTVTESERIDSTPNIFVERSIVYPKNPATDRYWTWEEINDLQVGVALKTGSTNFYTNCTQVYATVIYTDDSSMSSQTAFGWKILPIGIVGAVIWGIILYLKNLFKNNNSNNQ